MHAEDIEGIISKYLLSVLDANPGDIKSKENMKNFSFLCPQCREIKPATELVLLTNISAEPPCFSPLKESTRKEKITEVAICCKDCWKKLKSDY